MEAAAVLNAYREVVALVGQACGDAYVEAAEAIVFVEGINGDFFNAVGFPVFRICEKIKSEFGIDLVFTGGEKNV